MKYKITEDKIMKDLKIQIKSLLLYNFVIRNIYVILIIYSFLLIIINLIINKINGVYLLNNSLFINSFILSCFIGYFVLYLFTYLSNQIEKHCPVLRKKLNKYNCYLIFELGLMMIVYTTTVIVSTNIIYSFLK